MDEAPSQASESAPVSSIGQWTRVLAWVLAAATIGLLCTALVLETRLPSGIDLIGESSSLLMLGPLISVLVGALIIDRKGSHLVGWLLCCSGLGTALAYLGGVIGSDLTGGGSSPAEDLLTWSVTWSFFLAFGLTPVLMVYVFPNGHLTTRRWRWFFGFSMLSIAIGVVGYAFAPGPIEDLPQHMNPYGIGGKGGDVFFLMGEIGWPLLIISIAGGVFSLRQRRRQASAEERQQIKWISRHSGGSSSTS